MLINYACDSDGEKGVLFALMPLDFVGMVA